MSSDVRVTIVILTYNGAEYIGEVLSSVFKQKTDFPYEVLMIDSGSTDETLVVAEAYPVRLMKIDKGEFNHGETRNKGAAEARGEFVCYLTQDATPRDETWLQSMIEPFSRDKKIVAVFGKHVPRADCNPVTERDTNGVFAAISPDDRPVVRVITSDRDKEELENFRSMKGFYSDVNSCLRKSYWKEHPYKPLDYAEDQVFGREVLLSGHKIAYSPKAAVLHSHNYRPATFVRRFYDEYRGLNIAIGYRENITLLRLLPSAWRGWRADVKYIKGTGRYKLFRRVRWYWYAWLMNLGRRVGAYFAARYDRLPPGFERRMSLERGR